MAKIRQKSSKIVKKKKSLKVPKIGLNGLFKRFVSVFLTLKYKMGSKNTFL
jgi:hypothetical protein